MEVKEGRRKVNQAYLMDMVCHFRGDAGAGKSTPDTVVEGEGKRRRDPMRSGCTYTV